MSTLSVTRNYADGDDLTEAELDAAFDSLETWGNGSIGTANIATNGVDTAQLATNSVTAAKIASDAVTTAKILDGAVTGAKLNSGVVDNSTLAYSSSTLKVKDGGVGTTQLADAGVTQAKRAALGQQLGSGLSTSQTTTSSSFSAVTGCSAAITTTGRPVFVALQSYADGTNLTVWNAADKTRLRLKRDTTVVSRWDSARVPFFHVDTPTAGTYTYSLEIASTDGTTAAGGQFVNILVFEL